MHHRYRVLSVAGSSVPSALAAGDVQIDFAHTSFSVLESAGFLLGMVLD